MGILVIICWGLIELSLILGSIYMAVHSIGGWGWLLFVALLLGGIKVNSNKKNK